MIKRLIQFLACIITVMLMSGCATVVMRTSLSGSEPKGLYPATRADVTGTMNYCQNQLDPTGFARGAGPTHHPNVVEKFLWVVFATIDLPISLVTDTVCLPFDLTEKKKMTKGEPGNAPP